MFITLEDETGLVNVIVRPDVYRLYRSAARNEPLIVVEGRMQSDGTVNVMAEKLAPFARHRSEPPVSYRSRDFR